MVLDRLTKDHLLRDHAFLLKIAHGYKSSKKFDKALSLAENVCQRAYEYNYLDTFGDDELERLINEISEQILPEESNTSLNGDRIVFFDSFAFDMRGFTQQYLYALWELGYRILFIRSNNNNLHLSKDLLNEIKLNSSTELLIIDSSTSLIANAEIIYSRIKAFRPAIAILHLSPWDVLAGLVFSRLKSTVKYQIDFTDHSFWLGRSITDKLITFRQFGVNVSAKFRGIDVRRIFKISPYAISNYKTKFKGFPISSKDYVVGFTGGATYKIYDKDNTFLKLIKTLLKRHSNFVFLFAQIGDDSFIKQFILENGLLGRFFLLGNRDDIQEVFNNIDIYINTYPYGGGNMILYAANSKKPVLALEDERLPHTHLHNVIDIPREDTFSAFSIEEFLVRADDLINNSQLRIDFGQLLFEAISNKFEFIKKLNRLLKGQLKNAEVDPRFSLDTKYLTETHIEFQKKRIESYYAIFNTVPFWALIKDNLRTLLSIRLNSYRMSLKKCVRLLHLTTWKVVIKRRIVSILFRIIESNEFKFLLNMQQSKEVELFVRQFKCVGENFTFPKQYLIKNPQYIKIGKNFASLYNLRIEAWDEYAGQRFKPEIIIGDNVSFNTDIHIGCINKIVIGNNVMLASRIYISDHSHGEITREALHMPASERPLISKGPVIIEDNVWIGEGVCVLPGVTIGKNAIVGANAVVTNNIPANAVAVGVPAKVVKML